MAKVSVIVPIYNVALYIEHCVRSLFEQTLDDIEYIFVNDCTPDNSMDILHTVLMEYPHRQQQVKIINYPKNLGAAQARKDGIEVATGQYITHCDSDDWVDRDYYRAMYEKAIRDELDYVICTSVYKFTDEDEETIKFNVPTNKKDLISAMIDGAAIVSLWASVVKRSLYDNPDFIYPTSHMREDLAYSVQLAYFAQVFGTIDYPYYHYRQHNGSICADYSESGLIKKFKQTKANIELVESFLSSRNCYSLYKDAIHHVRLVALGLLVPLFKQSNKYWGLWLKAYPDTICWMLFSYRCHSAISLRFIYLLISIGLYPWISRFQK